MADKIIISLDGVPQNNSVLANIVELEIDSDYFLPAMLTLMLRDENDEYIKKFGLGKAVAVKLGDDNPHGKGDTTTQLFVGEITSLEPVYGEDLGRYLRVRAYDRAHRLMRGKHTRTFADIDDSAMLYKISSEVGLTFSYKASTKVTHKYFMQYNQSNWELLWARAKELGAQVYVDDRKLVFDNANSPRTSKPIELTWGVELSSFEPHVSVMELATETNVAFFDEAKKAAGLSIVTQADLSLIPNVNFADKNKNPLKKAFSEDAIDTHLLSPNVLQVSADAIAQAELSKINNNFIQADGFCSIGDVRLMAGVTVKIKNVGEDFSGDYYLTKVVHRWRDADYTTSFHAAGSGSYSMYNILNQDDSKGFTYKEFGLVRAIVTSIKDPDKLGRIQVKFPWLPKVGGADVASNWARISTLSGGADRGIYFSPEVDDEVVVAFEQGDIQHPMIVGALWNSKDKLPKGPSGEAIDTGKGEVNQRIIRSRTGHVIMLDDTKGSEQIVIQDKTGKNSLTFASKDNSVTFECDGDFTIKPKGKFSVDTQKDIDMKSTGKTMIVSTQAMSLEAKTEAVMKVGTNKVSLSNGPIDIAGNIVNIKSNATVQISGNAIVEIKGALVKIN